MQGVVQLGSVLLVTIDFVERMNLEPLKIQNQQNVESSLDSGRRKWLQLAERVPQAMAEVWGDLRVLMELLADYTSGRYRRIPWSSIAAAAGAVAYFASPADMIPDFLPMGFTDDAFCLLFVLRRIRHDLSAYRDWKWGVKAELVPIMVDSDSPDIHVFVHGYKLVGNDERVSLIRKALVEAKLPGSAYLIRWDSGNWDSSSAYAAKAGQRTMSVFRAAKYRQMPGVLADVTIGLTDEFTEFQRMEHRAELLGERIIDLMDALPDSDNRRLNLIGHSLGVRAIHAALKSDRLSNDRIHDCVFLGGIADAQAEDWPACAAKLGGAIYNGYSSSDLPLKLAPNRRLSVGKRPIRPCRIDGARKIINVRCRNVSHSDYWTQLPRLLNLVWRRDR